MPFRFTALFALLHNGSADVSLSDPVAPGKHDGPSRDLADVLAQDGCRQSRTK